jgi:hypothetical protein
VRDRLGAIGRRIRTVDNIGPIPIAHHTALSSLAAPDGQTANKLGEKP